MCEVPDAARGQIPTRSRVESQPINIPAGRWAERLGQYHAPGAPIDPSRFVPYPRRRLAAGRHRR